MEARTEAVDLVITDLVMPEQEGLETLQRLRVERPELPVIAISGAFGGSFLKSARLFGATAALPKPIDPEELLRAVREALTGQERTDSAELPKSEKETRPLLPVFCVTARKAS